MKITKKYIYNTIVSTLLIFSFGCNTSESEEEKEDREHEELSQKAAAYALSPANVARQAAAYSSDEGSGGSNGSFLWKPNSDSDGNLVVILPSSFKNVSSVSIHGSGGSASAGRGAIANGGRPHFRFGRSGGSFGHNITISGGGRSWRVSNGSERTEL